MVTVRTGTKKYIPKMKKLFKSAFGDGDEFTDLFFSKFYRPSRSLILLNGNDLVSMLFYMDVKGKKNGKALKGAYVYGCATEFFERGMGYFSHLHSGLFDRLISKGYDFAFLIPECESLFPFYKNLGYEYNLNRTEYRISTIDLEPATDISDIYRLKKESFRKSKNGFRLLESEEMFLETVKEHKLFKVDGGYLAFMKKGEKYICYDGIPEEGKSLPVNLIHYERSGVLLDISEKLSAEDFEKDSVILNCLLN